ncbi:MAG: 50S ribosomal protein L19 [Rhizobiales bacterium]|nr:50S ribosomal protein L19 [Hyphomicrobiales bacterium]
MNLIQQLEKEQADKLAAGKTIPDFEPGDTVVVNVKVKEGERTRIQAYEGVCIGRSGHGLNESFTVRKISYLRGLRGKKARIAEGTHHASQAPEAARAAE